MNQKKNIFESSEQGIEKSVDSPSDSAEVEKLEQELKQCQAKAGMLDVIPTPVMAVDRDLNVTYMNIAGAKAMGSSQEDLIGKKCFHLFNTGHCNTEHCRVKKAMEQDGEFTGDTRAKLPGGETPIRYTGTPIKDDSGNIVGALEYVLDISKEAAITDEIDKLSQAAVEGKLDSRADADQFEGNYAQIVSGVNNVLDAVISPLNVAAEYIDRISKGDIPEKITEEYAGDFNEIKNNFNRCIDSINGLLSEGQRLVGEAVEGNLLERGSEDNFSGEYANLMSGMNTLVDTLVGHIDKIPAPFMIVDTDFSIRYMNHHGADVLGSKQEQLIGSKCYHNFNTSDCKNGKCALAKSMQSGETARSETVAKPGDSELYISYTGSPITNQEGKITGALEIVMDQTETKKAIDDANEKVNLLDNIPTPVMAVDTDFNVNYMNPAGANALNRPQESVIGQKCFSLFNTGHCNSQDCRLKKAMEKDNEFTADTTARLPGGDLPIRYTGTPLKDESGKVVGGLEYVLDISKEISITQEVTKLSHAAIEGKLDTRADSEKFEGNYGEIVQGVNKVLDEVIAPLNVAAEYVDSIAKGDVPEKITEEYKGDFNEIKNNLNSLIDCMQEITYVAQEIASGNLTVEVEKRSEQDELMEALQTMVSDLSSIAVDVQTAAEQVATGSEQISSSAQKLSEGAQEQSSTIEEVSSSMEEMTSTVNQNAENAKETASIAEKAANDAQEGGSAVSETVGAMKSIAEKISIIEEIARQTNMLALNAAIEAARAGEQGKGFAVVASEVRKLAERSQNASKEISELTGNSVEKAEKAGNLIQEIVPGIQKTSELIQEINASSAEQAKGIQQVNDSVQQLDQVIQQSASSTEEMASTSEELSSQAEQLNNAAAFFKVEEEDVRSHKGVKKANTKKSGFKKKADTGERSEVKARPGVGKKTVKTGEKSFGARKEDRVISGKKGMHLNLQDEEDNEFERY